MNNFVFKNENVSVSFEEMNGNGKDYILIKNLTDHWNDPTAYTRKVRGIKLAWKFIEQIFNDERLRNDLKFSDIIKVLDEKFNLNVHTYCAVD